MNKPLEKAPNQNLLNLLHSESTSYTVVGFRSCSSCNCAGGHSVYFTDKQKVDWVPCRDCKGEGLLPIKKEHIN